MLNMVIEELAKALKNNLKEKIPSNNIILDKSFEGVDPNSAGAPLIAIYVDGFTFEDIGYGSTINEIKAEKKDEYSGDGRKTAFKLSERPLKPIAEVTIRDLSLEEFQDYRVDYTKSLITFFRPPSKGDKNIQIKYLIDKSLGEVRGLRLRVSCFIDIWNKDPMSCNLLTIDIVKTLLERKEQFVNSGITLVPQRGLTIFGDSDLSKKLYGRRLVYEAQVELKTEIRARPIEEIRLNEKKDES